MARPRRGGGEDRPGLPGRVRAATGPQAPQAAAPQDGPPPAPGAPAEPDGFRDQHGRERRLVARHRERYAAVQALRAEDCSSREIARRLGLARNTALKFAQAASIDELLVKATSRPSILDPFKPYLNQRWNQGITSAAARHEEIRARGWQGGILAVERYLRQFRTADGRDRQARAQPQLTAPSAPAPPSPARSPGGSWPAPITWPATPPRIWPG